MKRILGIIFILFVGIASAASAESIDIYISSNANKCVSQGAKVLAQKLSGLGLESKIINDKNPSENDNDFVLIDASDEGANKLLAGIELPVLPESYIVKDVGGKVLGIGADAVGAMYAAYDIAEQMEMNGGNAGQIEARTKSPFMEIRAVNPFFHVEAFNDPNSWYYDEEFWETYLDELSWDRYNLLDIHAMYELISTFFPNCYLYLLKSEKFPDVGIDADQAQKNLEQFNRIIKMAKDRGIKVSLMSYHASWHKTRADEDSGPQPSDDELMEYTREMVKLIIDKCPDLWMIGFRIGESGRREDFFEHSYIAGIKEASREVNMFTRTWLAQPWQVMEIADAYPGRTYIEIKYNGEQLGLPYHAMTANRRGTAPSYTYENYTDWPRNYKIIWQIRSNGTHRLFRWGDPEFAERTMRTVKFGSGIGFTMEPMTSYYPMTDYFFKPEDGFDYFKWDHQRNWFWYMVWGRLAYDPGEEEAIWLNRFRQKFGDAAEETYETVVEMSKLVPLIYSWRCIGPDHRNMAPEYETGGSLRDFSDNFPLDAQNIYSIREYVNNYLIKDPLLGVKLDPFTAADLLDQYAGAARAAADAASKKINVGNKEYESLMVELQMLENLAGYYSNKIRAATFFEYFTEKSTVPELMWALHYTGMAHEKWDGLSDTGDEYFKPILDTLRMRRFVNDKTEFTWSELKPLLAEDTALLEEARTKMKNASEGKVDLIVYHLPAYIAPGGENLIVSSTVIGGTPDRTVKLFYRAKGADEFTELDMRNDNNPVLYTAMIPSSEAYGEIEYFIGAVDGDMKSRYPGPGSAVRTAPRKYSAEEYADGSAKREESARKERIEYEKRKYVTVTFKTENDKPVVTPMKPVVTDSGNTVKISAKIDDKSKVAKAVLNFKNIPSGDYWQEVEMEPEGNGVYSAVVDLTPSGLLYYFHAADVNYNAVAYPDFLEQTPYLVIDSWDPAVNPYQN